MSTQHRIDSLTRRWLLLATALLLLPLLLQLELRVALGCALVAAAGIGLGRHKPLPGLVRGVVALGLAGLVLAVYRSIGRDTGCALLAVMLALKPTETVTLRDGRSLLGYGFFAPFSAFLLDQGPLSLMLGALGTVAGLLTLMRLADSEGGMPTAQFSITQSLRMAGRLVALALPLVLATFWLFPRLPSPLWGLPDKARNSGALSPTMTPDQWLEAFTDDTAVMRVRFAGPAPAPSQMYWRGYTLTDFDGRTWTPRYAPADDSVLDVGPARWRYEADIEPSDARLLPLLEFANTTPRDVTRDADATLRTALPMSGLTRWTASAAPANTFERELKPLQRAALLRVGRANPRTKALGTQWGREANGDARTVVQRGLALINDGFAYSLTVPSPGINWVDDFVFEGKTGYCQQFSTAFVLLMRAAGIPARVVTGYAGGYHNPVGDYWLVRRSDAHAWAEVWIAPQGWTRVDPTAAVAPERIYDTLADRQPGRMFGDTFGSIDLNRAWNLTDNLRRGWNDFVLGFNAERQAQLFQRIGIARVSPGTLVGLFVLAAALAVGFMAWWLSRAEREPDPLLRAWHALDRRYARLGLQREPHETAVDWAARVGQRHPQTREALADLAQRLESARYGRDARAGARLIKDLRRHRPRR